MKASELRIGNCVNYEQTTHIIYQISNNFCSCYWYKGDPRDADTHRTNDIKPIPLTEEWLLKFGFKKDNNFTWVKIEMELMQRDDGFWIWLGADLYLKYVHQLQNLYHALTGNELEIKENKINS